jgi:hypothetical protein
MQPSERRCFTCCRSCRGEGLRRLQNAVKPGGLFVVTNHLAELRERFRSREIVQSEETHPFTLSTKSGVAAN